MAEQLSAARYLRLAASSTSLRLHHAEPCKGINHPAAAAPLPLAPPPHPGPAAAKHRDAAGYLASFQEIIGFYRF